MILHVPANAASGTFLEIGCFLQNIMLGLVACGLGSCPQYSVAGYSARIRAELGMSADRLIVCSLAVGYPDPQAPVNAFVPERASLAEYTRWYESYRRSAWPPRWRAVAAPVPRRGADHHHTTAMECSASRCRTA